MAQTKPQWPARSSAELIERLQYFSPAARNVLALGRECGSAVPELRRRFAAATILAIDTRPEALRPAARRWRRWPALWRRSPAAACAEPSRLPLKSQSIDLLLSNLCFARSAPPDAVLQELARVLDEGGLLLLSMLGPDTLRELRGAWSGIEQHAPLPEFPDMHQVGDALLRAGFAQPVVDREHLQLHYPDLPALLRELEELGLLDPRSARSGSGTPALVASYERLRDADGLPATWEIIYGAAFGGRARAMATAGTPGAEVLVPADRIRRRDASGPKA